ncbi:unnamed protein product [Paramecium octaurelia]|uniref:Protein kinase domain-containing protein n=1 Tax=Paramecium octaurelia TaxID=43137 RepID=A0A8S1WAB8_PAROT|nr:unnamed protein product [Paramecium octaurelia]
MSQLKKLNQQVKQVKCITLSTNQSRHSNYSSVKTLPKPIASRPVTSIAKNKNNKVEAVKIDLVKQKKQTTNISVTRSTSSARTRSASNGPKEDKIPRILGDLLGPEIELADCQDFLLQLNEPQFKMDEDVMKERVILANRIANTIKVKKRIPTTTADYYKLCSVIGKGAFAKVCLGIQILTGAKVAMKIIDKSSLKNDSAKKRLMQEIALMKLLQPYKCCIRLYEVFETKRQIYLIMEYVEGGDLIKFTKEKPLSEQIAKNIFGQLVQALQILQNHNILHRDIKLDNILFQGEQIKLCDFGVSRQIVKGQKILEQCGTPAYLAPEIMTQKSGYEGFASDIWSSGILLYVLLVGKTPFKGNNMNELNSQIQSGQLNFMEIKKANLSNEAVDLMKSILHINPKLRCTLPEIMKHTWMKDIDFKQTKQQANLNLDLRIICQIEQYGYQREVIIKTLQSKTISHISALYWAQYQ